MVVPEFFVIGLPRSGTTWLARLFSGMNPKVLINHEAIKPDFDMDIRACFHPWTADEYVTGARQDRIDFRAEKRPQFERYGEITPRARYFSASLQKAYPHARFVHLVRDPRKAVVSLMNYGYYGKTGRPHRTEAPDGGRWSHVTRASWAWAYGHHRIRQGIEPFFRLEDLLTDFDAVRALGRAIGLMVNRDQWAERVNRPENPSQQFETPPWTKWPPAWRQELKDMAGKEAAEYGYAL